MNTAKLGGERAALRADALRLSLWIVIGLLAAAPLWGAGMVNTRGGGDSPFLLQRTVDMAESLRSGIFPVRWMSHAAYDLGYPFFNHYAALPFYVSGALTALGSSPILAIQATQTFGFLLAAVGMGLWGQRLFHRQGSVLLAVCAYTFAPFHMVNVYVRGDSLSEFYAFAWYVVILWTLDRAIEHPSWRRIVAAAAAYAALGLTHNVSFLIFTPFALLYALIRKSPKHSTTLESLEPDLSVGRSRWGTDARRLIPFGLGLLLSAWFWVPAIAETGFAQMDEAFTEGYFHYSNHFRTTNLVQSSPAFDYSVAGTTEDAGPFAMGLAQAAVALGGLCALGIAATRRGRSAPAQEDRAATYLVLGLLIASAMITPLSRALWDHLPLLRMTQFPWRFLSVQALFTAALSGSLIEMLSPSGPEQPAARWKRALSAGLALALSIALGAAALVDLNPERLLIAESDVNAEALLFYEAFTGNIGTTIRYEYLPRDVVPRLYISEAVVSGELAVLTTGDPGLSAELIQRTPVRQEWQVTLAEAADVSFPVNWWPAWRAQVNGEPAASQPTAGSGRLLLTLPAGENRVSLRLGMTWLQAASLSASALAAVGIGVVAWRTARKDPQRRATRFRCGRAALAGVIMAALAVMLPVLAATTPTGGLQPATFFDFDQMPYPHRGPVRFGNATLDTATIDRRSITPGGTLSVSMAWTLTGTPPLTATVRVVSPAEPRHGVSYTLAAAETTIEAASQLTLQLPEELPRGLYLVAIEVYEDGRRVQPRSAAGHRTGTVYLGALRALHSPMLQGDQTTIAAFSEITLHHAAVEQTDATTLRLKLQWSTPGTARNWSLSLRLLDADGRQLVQSDLQPGYGYLPTTLWEPGTLITDYPTLVLPEGLPPGAYSLKIIAYLEATGEVGGEVDIPVALDTPTLYDLRDACCEQTRKGKTILCALEGVALLGTDIPATLDEGSDLSFAAEWNVVESPTGAVQARWTLADSAGTPVGAVEGALSAGQPTDTWPLHAWVRAPVSIDLPPVLPDSEYMLTLVLRSASGAETVCELPHRVTVTPRPRVYEAPDPRYAERARFGSEIELLGYELRERRESLSLTVWWRAKEAPKVDLKRFVHLYDPQTEQILAQDDAMPRGWTYPTSWWQAGEVVSETVTLDLARLPRGEYKLALGWYDPGNMTRLAVWDAAGERQPDDRWVLGQPIAVR